MSLQRAQAKPVKAAEAKTVKGAVQAAVSEHGEGFLPQASTIKENAARTGRCRHCGRREIGR